MLQSPEFDFYLQKTPVDNLQSFGLMNGMIHPNFSAVHDFLNRRFNYKTDDWPGESALKDIE